MGIKIEKMTVNSVLNQFQYAFDKMQDVENFIGDDHAKKGRWIKDAYEAFYEPISTVFDDSHEKWSYLKNLSFSQQVAPSFYAVSLDYLLYEFQTDRANFDAIIYPKNVKAWETFIKWAVEAKAAQRDYLRAEMGRRPCHNPEMITRDIAARQAAFDPNYIDPITKYAKDIKTSVIRWKEEGNKTYSQEFAWGTSAPMNF